MQLTSQRYRTFPKCGVTLNLYESVNFFYDFNAWLPRMAVLVNQKAFAALDMAAKDAVP